MSGPHHLRAPAIAEKLGVHIRTVRRWIADETIPSKKIGGVRLVAEADLLRLFQPASLQFGVVEEESK